MSSRRALLRCRGVCGQMQHADLGVLLHESLNSLGTAQLTLQTAGASQHRCLSSALWWDPPGFSSHAVSTAWLARQCSTAAQAAGSPCPGNPVIASLYPPTRNTLSPRQLVRAAAEAEEARQRAWDEEDDADRLTVGPEGQGDLQVPSGLEVVGMAAGSAFLSVAVAGLGMLAMLLLARWIGALVSALGSPTDSSSSSSSSDDNKSTTAGQASTVQTGFVASRHPGVTDGPAAGGGEQGVQGLSRLRAQSGSVTEPSSAGAARQAEPSPRGWWFFRRRPAASPAHNTTVAPTA